MLLDEDKVSAMLKKEHKHGYDIIVDEAAVTVMTEKWMITMARDQIPRKVLGTLVEHMGLLPQAPASLKVIKGDLGNQELIWDVAAADIEAMRRVTAEAKPAELTKLIYEGLALWQAEDRLLYGAVSGVRHLLEAPERGAMVLDGDRIMWTDEGQRLIMTCFRPYSGIEAERWQVLESADWRKKE